MTAICWTSGARRRRAIASDTSWFIGSASQVRIGASDSSVILTSTWESRHERQLWRTLTRDGHGDFRTEPWRISTERAERLRYRAVDWDDHVHEEVPAVRRRRHVLNEQIVQAIVGMPICQREIQRALYLSAELPRLSFNLPT
jgi:hypothetical protein